MTQRNLRSILRAAAMVLGAALLWWRTHALWSMALAIVSVVLGLLAVISPRAYRPIGRALDTIQLGTVKVISWSLLGLVFLAVFVPARIFAVLSGRLLRLRSRSEMKDTYWQTPVKRAAGEAFEKQF